jgi:hypothetical protein
MPLLLQAYSGASAVSMYDVISNFFGRAATASQGFMQLGAFGTAARAVAMIGATWYIFSRVWGPIFRGEPIDFFPLFRPFVLLMAIVGSTSICDSLDRIFNDLDRKGTFQQALNSARAHVDDAMARRNLMYAKLKNDEAEDETEVLIDEVRTGSLEEAGWLDQLADSFSLEPLKMWLVRALVGFFDGVGILGYFALSLYAFFMTAILRFVAPLAFAFAVFDAYAGNAAEWFAKYINAKLLLLITKGYTIFCYYLMTPLIADSLEMETGQTFLYVAVVLISAVGYLFVPSMAQLALSVGGAGSSTAAVGRAVLAAGGTARATGTSLARGAVSAGRTLVRGATWVGGPATAAAAAAVERLGSHKRS